jgi:hypothetical protein
MRRRPWKSGRTKASLIDPSVLLRLIMRKMRKRKSACLLMKRESERYNEQ